MARFSILPLSALVAIGFVAVGASAHAEIKSYRTDEKPAPVSTSVVQRAYDATMRGATTMAGAPNAIDRGNDDAERLRVAPNAIDRAAKGVLNATADVGGANKAFATETEKYPRHVMESNYFRNRPLKLGKQGKTLPLAPVPGGTVSSTMPISGQPPVIYDASAPAAPAPYASSMSAAVSPPTPGPAVSVMAQPATAAQSSPILPVSGDTFVYRKIDQSKTLTTPHLNGYGTMQGVPASSPFDPPVDVIMDPTQTRNKPPFTSFKPTESTDAGEYRFAQNKDGKTVLKRVEKK